MTTPLPALRHWRLEHDLDNLLWVTADREGASSNVLSSAVLIELDTVLDWAAGASLTGLVLRSAKPGGFILGADIGEFDGFSSAEEVSSRIRQGQRVLDKLEKLACPTVACVHGFCLGGGLELALACGWILARDVESTRLGFPEVKLGIFPALGGVTRGSERLGGLKALELMLTARNVRAPAARALGLVDELVGEFASLDWAARRAISRQRRRRSAPWLARLTNTTPARYLLAPILRRRTAKKADPAHYPAPFAMIDLWQTRRGHRQRMFDGEALAVGELMVGNTARQLRRLFFLSERMKRRDRDDMPPVRRVHVVGAGVMGGDIAAWCVVQGLQVSLQDRDPSRITAAQTRARKLFSRRLKRRPAIQAAESRLLADPTGVQVPRADVVIEAIVEDADAKRALFAELEPRLAPHTLLATNTSAISLAELTRDLADPSRLVGVHFFNPVARMPLVEVVHDAHTDPQRVARACAFCTGINRLALPVRSAPGFLVNRVLAPYLVKALQMMSDGIDMHTIDAVAVRFGMPMGPIELADTVGLDVCLQVADTLVEADAAELAPVRRLLQSHLDAGRLGRKSGEGFRVWSNGRVVRRPSEVNNVYGDLLENRLMKPLLLECRAVSDEALVEDDDLLDAGVVFGTGFAPFTGGPLQVSAEGSR